MACRAMKLDAIIMLEQTAPGKFARHAIETSTCDHATCDLGDYDGDGTIDIVTGNFINLDADPAKSMVESDEDRDAVILLKNLGPRRRPKEKN